MQPLSTELPEPGLDSLSNMQWYMYQQRNIAFFGAFSGRELSAADLKTTARTLVELAPQLMLGFEAYCGNGVASDDLLSRVSKVEEVSEFEGFPDVWINQPCDINDRTDLPMFRIRAAVRQGGADGRGRASFVLVQVSHALVEGADSALLSRSRNTSRSEALGLPMASAARQASQRNKSGGAAALAGSLLGGPAALGHLLAARLMDLRPGPYGYASFVTDRKQLSSIAKRLRVRQRSLLFALGLTGLFGTKALANKKSVSTTYSSIDAGGEAQQGGFMHMRMLFASFASASDPATLARLIDTQLIISESRSTGFNDALNDAALSAHRWMHRRWPTLYAQSVFCFMPYEAVLGLIPPHRLQGVLTEHLQEPVFAGAALDGANACVIVPGRNVTSFNFYAQIGQLNHVNELDVFLRQQLDVSA